MAKPEGESLNSPFLRSAFEKYKKMIIGAEGGVTELDPQREFDILQAHHAGFVTGLNFAMSIAGHPEKAALLQEVKAELRDFSAANRKFAATLGVETKRF